MKLIHKQKSLLRAACLALIFGANHVTAQEQAKEENAIPAASSNAEGGAENQGNSETEISAGGIVDGALPGMNGPLEDPPALEGLAGESSATNTPTGNAVINLITKLVQKGILTETEATEMIMQAEQEAAVARQSAEAASILLADAEMAKDTDVVVTHIPDPVRQRMQEEIKQELMADAKEENWGGIGPAWAERLKFSGDFRMRYDGSMFPEGNDNTGAFPDFNRINTGDPFDIAGTEFSPQLNADEERHRLRIRARLGAELGLENGFTAGLRIATGNDSSPVSTNQTLGGSGGNFSKYALWLDRAFLKWETGGDPESNLAILAGRFDNPFFRSSEIMWDSDLGFDGFAVQARQEVVDGVTPFINAGLFPIYNTDFNFASNSPDKFESLDKWLYGVQFGVDLKKDNDIAARLAVALYEFDNVEGELSDPFLPLSTKDAGNTDIRRPSYAQKGNSYMALRNIIPDPLNNFGTSMQYQYFGLASKYQVLAWNGKVDFNYFEPVQISLLGEYGTNLAFDAEKTSAIAVNNRGSVPEGGSFGEFDGGDTAWNLGVQFGTPKLDKAGAWKALFGYRYVESDAFVDAFTESDFGLGGTNLEGFTAGFSIAVSPDVYFALKWMGANEIAGPPLKSDVLQFDINATF